MDAPPPIPPRPEGFEPRPILPPRGPGSQQSQGSGSAGPSSNYQPPPMTQAQQQQQNQQQGSDGWTDLFFPDGRPTTLFTAFMNAFFDVLDTQRQGYITPEQLSAWLDNLGFALDENVWKMNFKPIAGGFLPIDNADFELRAVLDAWQFDHRVGVRDPNRKQVPHGGGVPLLTRGGFIEYMAVESAADPVKSCRYLDEARRQYGVWTHKAPIPRSALLPDMPRELKQRIEVVKVRSFDAAQEKLAAARMEAQIAAQGRRAALDLVSDYRYEYRYY